MQHIKTIALLSVIITTCACAIGYIFINGIKHKSTFAAVQTFTTVDLGLSSGNLWTTCNIGAFNPWDYGDYYAWGETTPKYYYSWSSYSHCKGTMHSITKYCNDLEYGANGFTDTLTTLVSCDDAISATLDTVFSLPTYNDWCELDSQCYWVWTDFYFGHNVPGYIIYKAKTPEDKGLKVFNGSTPSAAYSISDTHIFLPAAGGRRKWNLCNAGNYGYYWSSTLLKQYPSRAHRLYFDSENIYTDRSSNRCYSHPIRPIRHK